VPSVKQDFGDFLLNFNPHKKDKIICSRHKDEVIETWKQLRKEIHDLYSSPTEGQTALIEEMRNTYRILTRKAIGKRPFGGLGVDTRVILKYKEFYLQGYNDA
jgi:hypothetical protein